MASVVAALNDADRSLIGDPRKGVYKVAFTSASIGEAFELARQLAVIGIIPRTIIHHDDRFGEPVWAEVTIYTHGDQRTLFETTNARLSPPRRQQLEDLVVARAPIPDEVLERISKSRRAGRTPTQIARRMNELDIMPGRGGKGWTARKIENALVEAERRGEQRQEAA